MNDPQPNPKPIGLWSRALIGTIAAFVLTVLLMVASAFGGQGAGLARFFDVHGLSLLGIEVGVIVGLVLVVLAVERRGSS